jgi:hypothetical protein
MNALKKKLSKIYILGQHPETDWQRLFTAFMFVSVIVITYSIFYFIHIKNEVFAIDSSAGNARVAAETKEKELREVIDRYEEKERTYLKLQYGESLRALSTPPVATTTATTTSPEI